MRNLRSDALALIGCIAIIVAAFFLLTYGRRHEVSSILIFGYALDALVTTGVIGNLIVFLLVKITRLKPLRIVFWTFLVINALPALALAFVGGRLSPNFKVGATLLGYAVSFLFWLGVHYLWAPMEKRQAAGSKCPVKIRTGAGELSFCFVAERRLSLARPFKARTEEISRVTSRQRRLSE